MVRLNGERCSVVLLDAEAGDTVTDEALMQQLQQGNRTAVEPLVRRYHRPLMAYYYRLSHDYHLAQDLAQECLFRLVSRAGLYRYPEPLRPWLYRMASNIWRDHAKSPAYRQQHTALPWEHVTDAFIGADPPPDEAVADHMAAEAALEALYTLPPAFSEVLVLRFGQSLTVPEIATVLDLPEGTVKSRIFHGLRHLRARLAQEEVNGHVQAGAADRATGV